MAHFRWPLPLNDVMLATEVATDCDVIASILSTVFSTNERKVVLTGRTCREKLDRILNKYLEDDKKALNPLFWKKTRDALLTLKILVTSNGKRLTSDRGLRFAVLYAKLDAKGLYYSFTKVQVFSSFSRLWCMTPFSNNTKRLSLQLLSLFNILLPSSSVQFKSVLESSWKFPVHIRDTCMEIRERSIYVLEKTRADW